MVAGFNFILALLILVCELLSLFDCTVDFILGQVGGGSDGDVLFIARAEILCSYMNDAVCIDIKADFDLRHTPGSGCNTGKLELAEALIVLCHLTLALKNMDFNAGLAVRRS